MGTLWKWSILLICDTLSCFPPLTYVFWLCTLIIHMGQGMEENEAHRRIMSRIQDADAVVFKNCHLLQMTNLSVRRESQLPRRNYSQVIFFVKACSAHQFPEPCYFPRAFLCYSNQDSVILAGPFLLSTFLLGISEGSGCLLLLLSIPPEDRTQISQPTLACSLYVTSCLKLLSGLPPSLGYAKAAANTLLQLCECVLGHSTVAAPLLTDM